MLLPLLRAKEVVAAAGAEFGARSKEHAQALLCMVHSGLNPFPEAQAIEEALAIMEELGLHQDEDYGSMLAELGGLDCVQGRCKEVLVSLTRPRPRWLSTRKVTTMGRSCPTWALVTCSCNKWSEAVACHKEAVDNLHGNNHPMYATVEPRLSVRQPQAVRGGHLAT